MTLPFVFPIITSMGFNEVWFGVFLVLVIEIALVTPPLGMNLFVTHAIAGRDTNLWDVVRGSIPFLVCAVIELLIITVFPEVVTWLPNLLNQ